MTRFTLPAILVVLLFAVSCSSLKQVSVSNHEFYNNRKVPDKIDRYNVYVHEGQSTYRLSDPEFLRDTLSGEITLVAAGTVNAHPDTKRELRESRKDMHIYLKKDIASVTEPGSAAPNAKVHIDRNSVDRVDLFATNEKKIFRNMGLVFLFVGLGVLITYLLIFALAKASGEAADGSDSNSNSGDSGGSDSGGSDSGCYIATMAYGSYDAPNVLVLRSFRDKFLSKTAGGRKFIKWYYANSPRFVEKHRGKKGTVAVIRAMLNGIVWILRPFFAA